MLKCFLSFVYPLYKGECLYSDVDMKDLLQKAEALVTDELPEGWQEVRDGSELYYWHIWTGTIQYERPVLSAVRFHYELRQFFIAIIIDSLSSFHTRYDL